MCASVPRMRRSPRSESRLKRDALRLVIMSWLRQNVGSVSDISRTFLATSSAPFWPTHLRHEEEKKKERADVHLPSSSLPECPRAYVEAPVLIFVKGDDFFFNDRPNSIMAYKNSLKTFFIVTTNHAHH